MTHKCGTCKHLGKEIPNYEKGDGPFGLIKVEPVYHECGLIQMENHDYDRNGPAAYVVDGSGYFAALCVRDEFGCNKWEPK